MNAKPRPASAPPAARDLKDLGTLAQALKAQREAAAAAERAALALRRRQREHADLFARSVGPVRPLKGAPRKSLAPEPPLPLALQHAADEQAVLREALSDGFDASALLEADEHLSFRRPGIGIDVLRGLRGGRWSIQRELDLHGLRSDEAREALGRFIRHSHRQGMRCVRVIHGKGLGSPGKAPVLKNKVHSWLVQKNQVLAFVQANPMQGGAGALVVLLRPPV
jgi:DNA-nicking Smr family endonuclease